MLASGKPALVRLKRNVSLTFTKIEVGLLKSFIQPNHGYLQASSRNSIDFDRRSTLSYNRTNSSLFNQLSFARLKMNFYFKGFYFL